MTTQRSDARAHDDGADGRIGDLAGLAEELDSLLDNLAAGEAAWADALAAVPATRRASARNMAHYWSLRQTDLRDLQRRLADHGLSSLGRSEAHVEATLQRVRAAARAMAGEGFGDPAPAGLSPSAGRELLQRRTVELLGAAPRDRETRIMVTLPTEAATDPDVARNLLERGMDVARINCAHDDASAWRAMAHHVRTAAAAIDRPCLIAMDLGGPKLRTGSIRPGPRVVKMKPRRDGWGRVSAPAEALLIAQEAPEPSTGRLLLPVPGDWLARRRAGDEITVRDTRGAARRLVVGGSADGGRIVTATKTTYLSTGTALHADGRRDSAALGTVPDLEQSVLLRPGDQLRVTRDCSPAAPDADGIPRIGCTLPEVFDNARAGDRIFFDDGKISGVVVAATPDALDVRIARAAETGSKLREAKGINVPDTHLPISALTGKDLADLATVVEVADIVQLSFVQSPADVGALYDALERFGDDGIGVVLKIETRRAFENLPRLLFAAMRRPRVGVMIARGDLAVEVGYERLAELQEEILWLCESAHLPVIWATQVLESLAKSGLPSRAEVSDAAMGARAECVMLNKGPHIGDAVTVLDDILCRMTEHHHKKSALMRRLRSWHPQSGDDG